MSDIKKFFSHGNLVDINVSMWTAQKLLTPEDLGLKGTDISSAFTLGKKTLIPAPVIAELRHYENRARQTLIDHSFAFTFGGARFVPKKAFAEFAEAIDKVIAQFDQKADELAKNYSTYRLEMRTEYIEAAKEAYARAKSLNQGMDTDEDTFINTFIQRIEGSYPAVDQIRKKFHIEYNVFQVALPDIAQASYEDLVDEQGKVKMMEEAYRRSLYNKVNSFVESCTNDLRSKATSVLTRFSGALKDDKRINEASLNSIKNMIEEYERMNFVGDDTLLKALKDFRIKCIDCYNAKVIREDKVVKGVVQRELEILLKYATDKSAIDQLVKKYRAGIGI